MLSRYSCKLTDAALKQKNVRLLTAFFTRTVWLNRSYVSRYAVPQPLLSAVVKRLTRSDGMNNCEAVLNIRIVCLYSCITSPERKLHLSKEHCIIVYGLTYLLHGAESFLRS